MNFDKRKKFIFKNGTADIEPSLYLEDNKNEYLGNINNIGGHPGFDSDYLMGMCLVLAFKLRYSYFIKLKLCPCIPTLLIISLKMAIEF